VQIEVGAYCSFSRQTGREYLQSKIFLIPIAIGAPLNHTNFVIQSLDEAELDLVPGYAICRDALPVPFDQGGKLLEGPEPLPLELFLPVGKELASPAFPAIGAELAELLLRLKRFQRFLSRFEKLDVMFVAFINFALIVDGLP
jgi:hypothetical protein